MNHKITKPKHCCSYCKKIYTNKTSYTRHFILCEIFHTTKRERICKEEENTNIPNHETLYKIVQEMALKYSIMEEKMEQMKIWIDQKKKKLNIIEWLNNNKVPEKTHDEWINNIVVNQETIENLFEETIVETIISILNKNTVIKDNLTMACFQQKQNVIYVYNLPNSWSNLSSE